MKLIVVNSNSQGNAYVLESSNGQQLCIEAGRPLQEVKKVANLKTSKCVGVIISHSHGDHAKNAKDFLKAGIDAYSTEELSEKCKGVKGMIKDQTYHLGAFSITPMKVEHDVPCFSFLIHHPEMGTMMFFTDCYNMENVVQGCRYFLAECNYDDSLLEKAVNEGKTIVSQADRIRLSHMSLAHSIEYLNECKAANTAKRIVLIHGSARHLNPDVAVNKFQQVLGVPTDYACKGLVINLM